MFGRFSAEWVALVTLLIVIAALVGGKTTGLHPAWAIAVFLGVYGFLRLAGRTPIGITYDTDPPARGHPALSVPASLVITALALRAGLVSALGTGQ